MNDVNQNQFHLHDKIKKVPKKQIDLEHRDDDCDEFHVQTLGNCIVSAKPSDSVKDCKRSQVQELQQKGNYCSIGSFEVT